jgi:hypothetical protein
MRTLIALTLLTLLIASPAYCQQRAGDFELQFFGTYFRTVGTDFTVGTGTIGGKIGPYITDHLQIGIAPTLSIMTSTVPTSTFDPVTRQVITSEETNTKTTFGASVFLVYSFLSSGGKLVPYFGAQYFKSDFNLPFSEDRGSAGINVGVKYFFAKKTALDFSGNYLWNLNPEVQGGTILFAFGLSFLF